MTGSMKDISSSPGPPGALQRFAQAAGFRSVVAEPAALSAAATATFASTQHIFAIIYPDSREQVQACVRIASEERVPLYPVSGGKNWGLGSRVPPRDGSVLLDLSRMNTILDFDEQLAWIRVEPGVTFRQAHEFLTERNSNLMLSPTGGPADGSLIGNAVERGDGIGPYGDRLSHLCQLEVVLPNGELLQTGFGRFPQASAKHVTRTTIGPHLDGVFTQSNLGIVTAMTTWLMRRPKHFQMFTAELRDNAALAPLLDTVRDLQQDEVLQTNCFSLWNSYKRMAALGRYPWTVVNGKTPLSLRGLKGCEPWLGTGAIYAASPELGRSIRRIVERTIEPLVHELKFATSRSRNDVVSFLGHPSDDNVRSVYWRKPQSPAPGRSVDPDRDCCGVIWLCPVLPLVGDEVLAAVRSLESLVHAHGFEPNIGLNCIEGRSVHLFLAILYDRDIPGEDNRAMQCHDAALQQLTAAGHYPYRLGIHSMTSLPESSPGYADFLTKIRHAVDPGGILAPGRYEP